MESPEKACCVVTVSGSCGQKPVSCSGVVLNLRAGLVLCTALPFSRFMRDKESLSDRRFLLHDSFQENLKIRLKLSEQRDLDANQCAHHEACAVAESCSPHQHQAEAQLLMLVNCVEFRRAFLTIFKEAEKWSFYGGGEEEEDAEMIRDSEFLSWFAVLKAPASKGAPTVDAAATATTTLPWVSSTSLRKGRTVLACGSPFGALCPDLFMGTLSKGIVSNLAGEGNAVLLTDARCLPGTEGGGLFVLDGTRRAYLAGVIVSPLCWKGGEWIGLTLACALQPILSNVARCVKKIRDPLMPNSHCSGMPLPPFEKAASFHSLSMTHPFSGMPLSLPLQCDLGVRDDNDEGRFRRGPADSSQPAGRESEGGQTLAVHRYPTVALVDSGRFWGSGVLVAPRLVLTCRHVVSGKSVVTLKFHIKDDRFCDVVGDLLFSSGGASPYDVAVLRLRDPAPQEVVPTLSSSYQPGEGVVVVGYGALGRSCGPSLTGGVLSRAVSWRAQTVMLQTTCAVQAGASGGAVVRAHTGELLGLVSSNTKDFAANVTYPHLNFSIPASVLAPLLRRYEQTGDSGVFSALDAAEEGVRSAWRLQAAHSKL